MDLRTGESLWIDRNRGLDLHTQPLDRDLECDVAIIGGGVTGALLADMLAAEGVQTVVLDKRRFGVGSTAASTALLMYELDASLMELRERYGTERADRCYRASLRAMRRLGEIVAELQSDCGLAWRKSLQFASKPKHARQMVQECEARSAIGIEVRVMEREEIESMLPFSAPAGLLSEQSADVDPVRVTHALMHRALQRGASAYSQTTVCDIHCNASGRVELMCERGFRVRARQTVIAAGYECQAFLPKKVGDISSTYVVCSKPTDLSAWPGRWLLWESSHPYIYMRTTPDDRVMMGGGDVAFKNEKVRDALLKRKSRGLMKRFAKLFPNTKFELDYAWAGAFGETIDGLPCIGSVPERPGLLFAMGYGGNGMTFGVLAAEIIRDHCLGRSNPEAELFTFDRVK